MAVNRRHAFLAGLPPPSTQAIPYIYVAVTTALAVVTAISALFLVDGPVFAATVRPYSPGQKPVAAKIRPWGCRDLSNPLVMMGLGSFRLAGPQPLPALPDWT